MKKNKLKNRFSKAIFSLFFAFLGIFGMISGVLMSSGVVYADPVDEGSSEILEEEPDVTIEYVDNTDESDVTIEEVVEEHNDTVTTTNNSSQESTTIFKFFSNYASGGECKKSLGAIGWLVCPATGKIAEAVDWLYDKIENILAIEPISVKDGSPIYEIWKYCRGLTNIVFIILLLVVIYSQITGLGISNYGIKKILPKLIIVAVLVNLSFLICSLAVDVSNILGNGLRGFFNSIAESAVVGNVEVVDELSNEALMAHARSYTSLAGGLALGIGGAIIAFETGAIWMLIPVVLGAVVAVASGLITIALRQAVVALLIMISPLAMVAYMLPNTDKWFTKWKDLLMKMLIFYPMFSVLFGASNLAGFAIIASAKDGFGIMLGIAVQIFPLFFSWNLMKMSGTFLGSVNSGIRGLVARPLAANAAWASSHRQLTQAKHLERDRMPSAKLMNFLAYRQTNREADISEMNKYRQTKYLAARALSSYDKEGNLSKHGKKEYDRQALSMRYAQIVEMHKNNMNEGFSAHNTEYKNTIAGMKKDFNNSQGVYASALGSGTRDEQIHRLDMANLRASDDLKFEMARGAKIEFDNATGFQKRATDAINAHFDQQALETGRQNYKLHDVLSDGENIARYKRMKEIMESREIDVHFAAAEAASSFNSQAHVVRNKFQTYMDLTAPTQDVVNRLSELTKTANTADHIDPIIAGLKTLNMRGDTDLVREQLKHTLGDYNNVAEGKIKLGTYASQSLANFLMFDVKDNDPFLRRFGKYINLETARMYNEDVKPENKRTRSDVSFYEYVNGEYVDRDVNGNVILENGVPKMVKSKRDAGIVLKGTSFKGMERTAIKEMTDAIRDESYDLSENGEKVFNYDRFVRNEKKLWDAIMPNIIGDQFSYLSGSEQIVALGKGLTGVDVKDHKIDWRGIFGESADSLTPEQKADYLEILNKRTKTFLGGHVPIQIARTKTDMLEAIQTQFTLREAIRDGIEYNDDGSIANVEDPNIFEIGFKNNRDGYNHLEQEKFKDISDEFAGSFKEDALDKFNTMWKKGFQGEAKDGLIRLLKDKLDKLNNNSTKRTKKQIDDEDDEGPVNDYGGEPGGGGVFNDARVDIESLLKDYRGPKRMDVGDFWEKAKVILSSMPEMGDLSVAINEIEESLSQYTDVSQLYDYIMQAFFGSD